MRNERRVIKLLLLCLSLCPAILLASNIDYENNTQTVYENRTYTTVSTAIVQATLSDMNAVLDMLIDGLINDPVSLFDNIFDGLGRQGEGQDIFTIEYVGYEFDPETGLYTGILNIYMGRIRVSNIHFTGKISRYYIPGERTEAFFELKEINSVVRRADGRLIAEKIDDKTIKITQTANFRFAWIFNIFFSMSNYRAVAEWRLDKLLSNIRLELQNQQESRMLGY